MSETPSESESAEPVRSARCRPDRVLILAPFGQDAPVVCRILSQAGFGTERCADIDELCMKIEQGAAAALITEEALTARGRQCINSTLANQPPWSDFPLLLLISEYQDENHVGHLLRSLNRAMHLVLLERPLYTFALVSAVQGATQARQRQYQIRDELAARKQAEEKLLDWKDRLEQRVIERTSELSMLCNVASMANSAQDVEAVILYVLQCVCEFGGWCCGHAWFPADSDPNELLSTYSWYEETSSQTEELRALIATVRLVGDDSLAGRVFSTGQPEFTTDLGANLAISKAPFAQSFGIQAACAIPVLSGDESIGVIELFARKPIENIEAQTTVLGTVGTQLGLVIERVRSNQSLRESEQRLDLALTASELGLWEVDLVTDGLMVDKRWASMLGYAPDAIGNHVASWKGLIHPGDMARVEKTHSDHVQGRIPFYEIDYRLRTQSGEWKWIRSRGSAIEYDQHGKPLRLIGTHCDITNQRQLERAVLESAAEEQRRMGQELHDSIGSELAGIGFMIQGLYEDLHSDARPEAGLVEQIGNELDHVIEQVRLLSHGLQPVEFDRAGLEAALDRLARRTTLMYEIPCIFRSEGRVEIEDNFVADHLYRIAQEAVINAVKHAEPGRILVTAQNDGNRLVLQIEDDGIGIQKRTCGQEGIGHRNMRYRADLIGANLEIQSVANQGTLVRCQYRSEKA